MRFSRSFKLLINFIRLTLAGAIVLAIILHSWANLLIIILAVILTFLPEWVEKKYNIYIPLGFEFAVVLLIYASLFLGEVGRFYERFWWWDVFLHSFSSIAFSCLSFIALFFLFKADKIKGRPIWIAIFSFCFSVAISTLWEIFEFFMDQTFGFNMQKSGLMDTMGDLISASGSALLVATIGYFYLKSDQKTILHRWLDWIIKKYLQADKKIFFVTASAIAEFCANEVGVSPENLKFLVGLFRILVI